MFRCFIILNLDINDDPPWPDEPIADQMDPTMGPLPPKVLGINTERWAQQPEHLEAEMMQQVAMVDLSSSRQWLRQLVVANGWVANEQLTT